MDSMDLEREKGITIQSAATHCTWKGFNMNIIDTPGHVDFTVEVERALRVLDGAILVLCGVGGVQSQSITVDRQMKRYNIPRLCFINKLDRQGANPDRVIGQLRDKLKLNASAVQVPIGLESSHQGVVDIIRDRAVTFSGPNGDDMKVTEVPAEYKEKVEAARSTLIERLSEVDEEMGELYLMEEKPTQEPADQGDPALHDRAHIRAGVHGIGVQEQGRAAAAGRRGGLPAGAERGGEQGAGHGRQREGGGAEQQDEGQPGGAGVQAGGEQVRPADVSARAGREA